MKAKVLPESLWDLHLAEGKRGLFLSYWQTHGWATHYIGQGNRREMCKPVWSKLQSLDESTAWSRWGLCVAGLWWEIVKKNMTGKTEAVVWWELPRAGLLSSLWFLSFSRWGWPSSQGEVTLEWRIYDLEQRKRLKRKNVFLLSAVSSSTKVL